MDLKKEKTNLSNIINDYNNKISNLKKNKEEIIDENDINDLNESKEKTKKYKDLISKDNTEEAIIIYKIPFKYTNNLIIIYNDNNINIQNSQQLYFKITEINDEFKNKFKVREKNIKKNISSQTKQNTKKGKKNKNNRENNSQELLYLNNDNNEKRNVKDYIFFNKVEEIKEYKITFNDIKEEEDLNNYIKNKYLEKNMKYPKVSFKGKYLSELINYINKLKKSMEEIDRVLMEISKGEFEKINIENIKNEFKSSFDNITRFFDI